MDRLMWDLDRQLESLARREIDLQLISPSPLAISGLYLRINSACR